MGVDLTAVLRASVKAVPAMRYAIALTGLAAGVALISSFLPGMNLQSLFVVGIGAVVSMAILLLFSISFRAGNQQRAAIIGVVFLWAVCLFVMCFMMMTISAIVVGQPESWAKIIGLKKNVISAVQHQNEIDSGPVARPPNSTTKGKPIPPSSGSLAQQGSKPPLPRESGGTTDRGNSVPGQPHRSMSYSVMSQHGGNINIYAEQYDNFWRLHVSFIPDKKYDSEAIKSVSVYTYQRENGKNRDYHEFGSIKGNWKIGSQVAYQINVSNKYIGNGWVIYQCWGDKTGCRPDSGLQPKID